LRPVGGNAWRHSFKPKLLAVALLKIRECCSQAIFKTAYLVQYRHQPVGNSIDQRKTG